MSTYVHLFVHVMNDWLGDGHGSRCITLKLLLLETIKEAKVGSDAGKELTDQMSLIFFLYDFNDIILFVFDEMIE